MLCTIFYVFWSHYVKNRTPPQKNASVICTKNFACSHWNKLDQNLVTTSLPLTMRYAVKNGIWHQTWVYMHHLNQWIFRPWQSHPSLSLYGKEQPGFSALGSTKEIKSYGFRMVFIYLSPHGEHNKSLLRHQLQALTSSAVYHCRVYLRTSYCCCVCFKLKSTLRVQMKGARSRVDHGPSVGLKINLKALICI